MVFDPNGAAAILAIVLTAPGVVIVGALCAAITEALKSVPGLSGLATNNPVVTVMILSALVVLYAAWATGFAFNPTSGFGLFLLWLADNGFAKASYDKVVETFGAKSGDG